MDFFATHFQHYPYLVSTQRSCRRWGDNPRLGNYSDEKSDTALKYHCWFAKPTLAGWKWSPRWCTSQLKMRVSTACSSSTRRLSRYANALFSGSRKYLPSLNTTSIFALYIYNSINTIFRPVDLNTLRSRANIEGSAGLLMSNETSTCDYI